MSSIRGPPRINPSFRGDWVSGDHRWRADQTKLRRVPAHGLETLASDGLVSTFADGHTRQLPRLTSGPFRYRTHADQYLKSALPLTDVPLKQAVISASALSLLYPSQGIDGYSKDAFLEDLIAEAVADIRGCLEGGAHRVQIDFTEGRLSVKLDPSKRLQQQIEEAGQQLCVIHIRTMGRVRSPDPDALALFGREVVEYTIIEVDELRVGNFYLQLASERNPERALRVIKESIRPGQRVFVGVIDVLSKSVETPELVRDRVLKTAEYVPAGQLGTTDDCGFSPFEDDTSRGRDLAFAKIRARVLGTQLASESLKQ